MNKIVTVIRFLTNRFLIFYRTRFVSLKRHEFITIVQRVQRGKSESIIGRRGSGGHEQRGILRVQGQLQ